MSYPLTTQKIPNSMTILRGHRTPLPYCEDLYWRNMTYRYSSAIGHLKQHKQQFHWTGWHKHQTPQTPRARPRVIRYSHTQIQHCRRHRHNSTSLETCHDYPHIISITHCQNTKETRLPYINRKHFSYFSPTWIQT